MAKNSTQRLLLVEDNPGDARLLSEMLVPPGSNRMELRQTGCMSEAEKYLGEHAVDIVLLDLGLPDTEGLEAVRRAHAVAPRVPPRARVRRQSWAIATAPATPPAAPERAANGATKMSARP